MQVKISGTWNVFSAHMADDTQHRTLMLQLHDKGLISTRTLYAKFETKTHTYSALVGEMVRKDSFIGRSIMKGM